jgi:hypothetical protein
VKPELDKTDCFEFPLVRIGFANSLAERFGLSHTPFAIRFRRISLLILVTWVPLLILSIASGRAVGNSVDVALFHDPTVCARFLFVLPILELAEAMVAISLPVQARHFLEAEIVPEHDRQSYFEIAREVIRYRSSIAAECVIGILSFITAIASRILATPTTGSSWEHLLTTRSPAGWWYAVVSLPIMFFFLLRWVWIFLLWAWFLYRVSKLDLKLTPTHPDHAGGLGFLGWGLASFSLVLVALASVFSSGFFYQILHQKESLDSLKYHMIVFIAIALAILHAPLLVFVGRLSRCRFKGLLDFSTLVLRYDRRFEEKWIEKKAGEPEEELLGSADIQSLADISSAYGHVNDMLLVPFDMKGFAVLASSAILPMLPLVGTAIPLQDILTKLGGLLV